MSSDNQRPIEKKYRKKLIEVALPLEAINKASAHEKMPGIGAHPRGIHLWWARRPLTTCRAVLFASLVDDPSSWPELFPTEESQEIERLRLFSILQELVKWKNSNNRGVLLNAQKEIARSVARERKEKMPNSSDAISKYIAQNVSPILDPFSGMGSIPLEAHRLGLRTYAGDLNPVAVLITKSLIEIPPKFNNNLSINPKSRMQQTLSTKSEGAKGLAQDVRYYGEWMLSETRKQIGHLYPKVKITEKMVKERPDLEPYSGKELTVIAWLWTRTIKCPNPGCGARTPLVRSFFLSKKKDRMTFLEPILDNKSNEVIRFKIKMEGTPHEHTTDNKGARCLFCQTFVKKPQLREISIKDGIESIPFGVVVEGRKGRLYLSSDAVEILKIKKPSLPFLDQLITNDKRWFSPPLYGLTKYSDIFTARQLVTLSTLSNLVQKARKQVLIDAKSSGTFPDDERGLDSGGIGAVAYADAISIYLAFLVDRCVDFNNSLTRWVPTNEKVMSLFARQAMPMVWDYTESNTLENVVGGVQTCLEYISDCIETLPNSELPGYGMQIDATSHINSVQSPIIATDPPYYDNIGYADLSDFFYIWLRNSIASIYPIIFTTLLTPKKQELIAYSFRHEGSDEKAMAFFEEGLGKAFSRMHAVGNPQFPTTIFYAFKQTETETGNENVSSNPTISTGWDTMLTGLIKAGFTIQGTWPMRSEQSERIVAAGTNALASSIVLVCRPRPVNSPLATRREFITALKQELPSALKTLQQSSIAPVDLAQAAIGPGMAVFTRYSKVMESDGSHMTVRTALTLINQTLDEVLAEQEGEFDADTRWAIAWFEQYGMNEGPFGTAETLSRAKNTAINALVGDGLITAKAGKVKLVIRNELSADWDPASDQRPTAWESTQHLIRALDQKGERGAAELLKKLGGGLGETARDLAYRLYVICDRKKWTTEALAYNSLITSWLEIQNLVHNSERETIGQQTLANKSE